MAAEIITLRDGNDLGRQLPPPGMKGNLLLATKTPGVNTGSFSYEGHSGKALFPFEASWGTPARDYAEEARSAIRSTWEVPSEDTMRLKTKMAFTKELPIDYERMRYYPTDPLSGLPYPILITDASPGRGDTRVDYHHQFHPRATLEDTEDAADAALRVCRGEDLPRWLHDRYHSRYDGLRLPATKQDKFAVVVLACAGVVPRQAMLLKDDRSLLITTSNEQYRRIISAVHYEYKSHDGRGSRYKSQKKIGRFFAEYALEQNIRDIVTNKVINSFLSPRSNNERWMSGNQILLAALHAAAEPIKPMYVEAFKEMGARGCPPKIGTIVRNFFVPNKRADYFPELERRLVA